MQRALIGPTGGRNKHRDSLRSVAVASLAHISEANRRQHMNLRESFDARVASVGPLLLDGFVSAVASDTLTERQLAIYLAQDVHYLESLAGILLDLRDAFTDPYILEVLSRHSSDALKTCSDISRLLVQTPVLSAMSHDPIRPPRTRISAISVRVFG